MYTGDFANIGFEQLFYIYIKLCVTTLLYLPLFYHLCKFPYCFHVYFMLSLVIQTAFVAV